MLRTEFESPDNVRGVRVRCGADFCRVEMLINGRPALSIEDYSPLVDQQLAVDIRPGRNDLLLQCTGSPGPSAVALELIIESEAGRRRILTGADWKCRSADAGSAENWRRATSFGRVADELWGVGGRGIEIDAFDDYEQWRDALGERRGAPSFFVPDGFEVERLRSAQKGEGSWVSLAYDRDGSLIVAREDKGLLRMTLAADGKSVESVSAIEDSLLECRGLAFHGEVLYVNANNSKGLCRLRDTTGDGRFDDVTLVREFPGNVGHGRNDLALGPHGALYSIHGDAVDLPTENIVDRTSPFRAARQGQNSREGGLLRYSLHEKQWELICAGLRNPFGVALHPEHGEPFTYDADAEHDMGAPWYRPTRVVHLVSGADYGWRGVTGKWPPYYPDRPDNALPVMNIGKGSPTAVKFGDRSSFPPRYRNALFLLDWAYGRILAVHLFARGAGYCAQAELFMRGRPLNVTDLDFGPDGAMYIVTGGRKTQSDLYRIRYVGAEKPARQPTSQHLARETYSAAARATRRQLEALHIGAAANGVQQAWDALDHPDPAIRHVARIAIEHQPVNDWRQRALAEERPTAALTALMALARSEVQKHYPAILERLNEFAIAELTATQQLTALRVYSLCLADMEGIDARLLRRCGDRLHAVFPAPPQPVATPSGIGGPVNRELSRLLLAVGASDAVGKTMDLLLAADDPAERIHYLFVLREARKGWTPALRRAYFAAVNDAGRYVGGRGLPGFLQSIRGDAVATLSESERADLKSLLDPPSFAMEETPLPKRPFVRSWTLDDLAAAMSKERGVRDLQRGKKMFREALCERCHRVGAVGAAVGPDLTSVASRFSGRDMLASTVAPSDVVAEPYRMVDIVTVDGRTFSGQLVVGDYRSRMLKLIPDPLRPSQTIEIAKQNIAEHRVSKLSPMPKGLLDTLSREEILDLLAFLQAGGMVSSNLQQETGADEGGTSDER